MGETIGIIHPGEMGAGVAGALVSSGQTVLWAGEGRSEDTKRRAKDSGLVDAGDLAALLERCQVIMSICPPHAALDVARDVRGFAGTYVDLNAISPSHAGEVAAIVESGGASYVDGGIIGAPPPAESTRVYLSGDGASAIAALFRDARVPTYVLEQGRFAASAAKMSYAAWNKGTLAMMLAIRGMAKANGVEDALVEVWSDTAPDLLKMGQRAARQAEDRGWRWDGEMAEIAATFIDAGLPGGFHEAAGEIYARVPRKMAATVDDATLAEVLDLILRDPAAPA
jgi:3-hydroxyisobutyrate dehydrogenase-like beta-hydroxyacid dehydrogenase